VVLLVLGCRSCLYCRLLSQCIVCCNAAPLLLSQGAEEARSALSAEQAKTLKLETQVAELTDKLGSVQVRHNAQQGVLCIGAFKCKRNWWLALANEQCPAPHLQLIYAGLSCVCRSLKRSCQSTACRRQSRPRRRRAVAACGPTWLAVASHCQLLSTASLV